MSELDHAREIEAMLRTAISLRKDADPLLAGQYEGLIGRMTALLAAMGAFVPEDAVPGGGAERKG